MKLLKLNTIGEAVVYLHKLLKQAGYNLSLSRHFDERTEAAVKNFQEKNNLVVDGIVYTKTWKVLLNSKPENTTGMELLKYGHQRKAVGKLQSMLVELGYNLSVSEYFNRETETAVKDFQRKNNFQVDGIVFTETWAGLFAAVRALNKNRLTTQADLTSNRKLSAGDVTRFAHRYDLEEAVIKAVIDVESNGKGFYESGRPIILFEGHIFWRQLSLRNYNPANLKAGFENVLYPSWDRSQYSRGEKEWDRLIKATSVHDAADAVVAAYASASYGLFQIMGFNYGACGYNDVIYFVTDMRESEGKQLEAFGQFLKTNNLIPLLQNHRWADFARRYNGPGYKTNKYDTRLAEAYKKHAK